MKVALPPAEQSDGGNPPEQFLNTVDPWAKRCGLKAIRNLACLDREPLIPTLAHIGRLFVYGAPLPVPNGRDGVPYTHKECNIMHNILE